MLDSTTNYIEHPDLVAERLVQAFDEPLALIAIAWLDVPADRIGAIDQRGKEVAKSSAGGAARRSRR